MQRQQFTGQQQISQQQITQQQRVEQHVTRQVTSQQRGQFVSTFFNQGSKRMKFTLKYVGQLLCLK
jgi:GH24 family phage-related lysozyme (muramidase)